MTIWFDQHTAWPHFWAPYIAGFPMCFFSTVPSHSITKCVQNHISNQGYSFLKGIASFLCMFVKMGWMVYRQVGKAWCMYYGWRIEYGSSNHLLSPQNRLPHQSANKNDFTDSMYPRKRQKPQAMGKVFISDEDAAARFLLELSTSPLHPQIIKPFRLKKDTAVFRTILRRCFYSIKYW